MNQTLLLIGDRQQSVLRAAQQAFAYAPHGYCPAVSGDSRPCFAGALRETRTGHYLLGNGYRAYDPVLMRFHRPDSLSPFAGAGVNAYAYCLGDPVNHRDPTGHLAVFGVLAVVDAGLTVLTLGAAATAPEGDSQDWLITAGTVLGAVTLGGGVLGGLFKKVDDILTLSRQALTRRRSLEGVMPEGRAVIENALSSRTDTSTFTRALRGTNNNLISHGDNSLSPGHARKYLGIANKVDAGEISNVSAHFESTKEWASKGGTDGAVGVLFNLAAAAYSGGAVDGPARKTGLDIRRVSP